MKARSMFFYFAMVAALCILAARLESQSVSPVRVPSDFASAHTVFIAPAGVGGFADEENLNVELYSSTYRMLQSLNHFQLVTSPAKADLSMEVSVQPGPSLPFMQMVARDTKTRAIIWTFVCVYAGGHTHASQDQKVIDGCADNFSWQLKALIAGTLPTPPSK